ncbi:ly6/PLAUR domain-containing protein 8 [Phodopus roborovskii]|uniref:ly6/PLAUR domain-containing protein 8 n=1 Tax=Phodopus roborovskii TaxID=109678 RepID=UPI0021E50012|nr:ly6/PLAUR domain-containing protein 8 [Phodopus roborovskii]
MKGILIAGVFAAFAITVIDSLQCRQCHVFNSTCEASATDCGPDSFSCVESSINSTLGGSLYSYQNKFCSKTNCTKNETTQVAFTVHVFDDQSFHFASQCCQGESCNDTNPGSTSQTLSNINCSACYGNGTEACQEETRQCFEGERCVHIIAEHVNGKSGVELKGCSDISESVCEILNPVNTTFGEFIFQRVLCTTPGSVTATTPDSVTVTTPDSATIQASFASIVFGSLLLLKLLI